MIFGDLIVNVGGYQKLSVHETCIQFFSLDLRDSIGWLI